MNNPPPTNPKERATMPDTNLQFRVNLAVLLDALATLLIVSANCPPVPVLGGVLLDGGEEGLTLAAFDYETSAHLHLDDVEVKQPGTLLISRAELTRILKAATKGETRKTWAGFDVVVTANGRDGYESTVVEVGGFDLHLEPLPLEDYPHLPGPGASTATVDRDELAALLPRVAVATDTRTAAQQGIPMVGCVCIEFDAGALTLVATDRFRVGVGEVPAVVAADPGEPVLIPVDDLRRIVDRLPAGPVHLQVDGPRSTLTFVAGDLTATVRTSGAEFPRWRQLFPAADRITTAVTIDRSALHKVVVKADALTGDKVRHLRVDVEADGLRVSPLHKGRGPAVPILARDGDDADVAVGVAGPLLLDALSAFDGKITLGLQSPSRPILITSADAADARYRHLLMPVRLTPGEARR